VSSAAAVGGAAVTLFYWRMRRRQADHPIIPSSLLVDSPYAAHLKLAVRMARQAGDNMRSHLDTTGTTCAATDALQISIKGGQAEDFCTQVDLQNEQLCIDMIQAEFPSHLIIGEEESSNSSGDGIRPLTKSPTWILDPIDGTTNFASGLPLCCVSIGFCANAVPVLGVVYAPATHEWYVAVKGYGAYRNGLRIVPKESKTSLINAVVGFEFGYARSADAAEAMVAAVRRILQHGCRSMRCLGTGVLDLCYVATGRLDVVYAGVANEGWKPWDYCAGHVIATESGCVIESIPSDKPFDLYSDSIICGTSKELVDELRAVIQ
jgi:fructose-1,6-bisphosphatase/inositol monophosphatase family enzyme